ncbi:ribosome recycling factor [Candidatus Uhrbacteria bacterium RIFCSPLOWO2_01_FULL_47_24]|uniref:Ribosome-recycling factor n=1 Tax=Candidatus Uhrbacteria bacterium RIFCSPLOWO2_01_FULL_47_24 TaxID=1802401 RepID=A0A1F7UP51_9BACT|nr:MAG: ribosome recycling factor [Candidatus Uhrbacteria bacterium RIFCSPHIGHO2_01_FULL_47_11]OGL68518.1 MAG: ribosome recycling factor [Candidatus Uhrbacteria bacterium RIFCSPHIGHO2_02_FULL_46_47]OGL76819.1 MAG: ribosome recycling factor [Candidatus Uhrbacteria bacterium RIFCSPHIGHO2_12_FULL_47_11]OGL80052.1 MAG: ribosome recycling factor [Candidatus Uhrbacteria bacterium RIFCSPLOWO2_01_FULL_47_24]OGL85267.1 MAG: ribosome recycling factor [Candidatus Uhrbacteria bacterium RIFCSPLOWO2_02_FULL_
MLNLDTSKPEFEKVVTHLKGELASLRGTRATPALVENVQVEAYGMRQALRALASIAVADPKTLTIEPWDKSIMKDIEKAIQTANIGINPVNEGALIRIVLPPLTEESRKELVKIVHNQLEDARGGVRTTREKLRQQIIDAEKKKETSEDEKYKQLEKLDKMVAEYNEQVKKIGESKEKEIMTI